MPSSNRCLKRGRISDTKLRAFLRFFCLDLTASPITVAARLNRNTINRLRLLLRRRMAVLCEEQAQLAGVVEIDESYFGPQRVRGKRGRGCGGKTIVFGLHKRGDRVFTQIIPDCSKRLILPVIRGHVDLRAIVHTDGWKACDGLVDMGLKSIFAPIIARMSSPKATGTLTASRASGLTPKDGPRNSMAPKRIASICISKNANSASSIDIGTCMPYY